MKHAAAVLARPEVEGEMPLRTSATCRLSFDLTFTDHRELLAEMQFSFVCFLVAHVYDGFEYWKQLVHLLCSCDEALHSHTELYCNFIGKCATA